MSQLAYSHTNGRPQLVCHATANAITSRLPISMRRTVSWGQKTLERQYFCRDCRLSPGFRYVGQMRRARSIHQVLCEHGKDTSYMRPVRFPVRSFGLGGSEYDVRSRKSS